LSETSADLSNIARLERSEVVLGDIIGQGGFSQVYHVSQVCLDDDFCSEHDYDDEQTMIRTNLAEATSSTRSKSASQQYVIKHLRKDLLSNSNRSKFHSAAADLVLEAQFLSRLDHPNIIKVRGWAAGGTSVFGNGSHDSYFLLFDRLDETLAHRIDVWRREANKNKDHSLSSSSSSSVPAILLRYAEKLDYCQQIASALEYLHQRRIVYRDLKTDNIGILGKTVQIFDFGLVRELPPSTMEGSEEEEQLKKSELFHMSGVGTRRYCAPEVVLGEGYNLQADVYSMTLVVYEMMTHIKPFAVMGPESHKVLVAEGDERPIISSEWPKDLQTLLEQGWAKCPSDRPTMKEVRQQLQTLEAAETFQQQQQRQQQRCGYPLLISHMFGSFIGAEVSAKKDQRQLWIRSTFQALPELIRKASGSFGEIPVTARSIPVSPASDTSSSGGSTDADLSILHSFE
jgi:serine/threonine protein kinase